VKRLFVGLVALLAVVAAACGSLQPYALIVNGSRIQQRDIDQELKAIRGNGRYLDAIEPTPLLPPDAGARDMLLSAFALRSVAVLRRQRQRVLSRQADRVRHVGAAEVHVTVAFIRGIVRQKCRCQQDHVLDGVGADQELRGALDVVGVEERRGPVVQERRAAGHRQGIESCVPEVVEQLLHRLGEPAVGAIDGERLRVPRLIRCL